MSENSELGDFLEESGVDVEQQEDFDEKSTEENIDNQGDKDKPEPTETEKRAIEMGWSPDYDGPNPISAHEYVRYGQLQNKVKSIESSFEEEVKNLNQLHKKQLEITVNKLKKQQREAVGNADEDEYDRLQGEISELEKIPEKTSNTKPIAVEEWEKANAWIYDSNNPKSHTAQGLWNRFSSNNPNATPEQALAYVDSEIARMFPESNVNPRRSAPSNSETPKTPRSKNNSRDLTMHDLSEAEREFWKDAGQAIYSGDEKKYLKAVKNARK